MKVAYSPYELVSLFGKGKREGALLRFQFDDELVGYADCHPWPELGDAPLKKQLQLIKNYQTTSLTQRSLTFARLDAEARARNDSLFAGLKIPPSHLTIPSLERWKAIAVDRCVSLLKVKLGANLPDEVLLLYQLLEAYPWIRVRLDFNHQLTRNAFEKFLEKGIMNRIDFYEDPFPYEERAWKEVQEQYGVRLAYDRGTEQPKRSSAAIRIIKPAIQEVPSAEHFVVTSYLDHPIGQLAAAYVAALTTQETCGLLTHLVYEKNAFSERLRVNETILVPPTGGTGFGFDNLLLRVSWFNP